MKSLLSLLVRVLYIWLSLFLYLQFISFEIFKLYYQHRGLQNLFEYKVALMQMWLGYGWGWSTTLERNYYG